MYRRYGVFLIATSLLASGCTQTVRHTNTLLFATNTQIAISAGTSATAQPDVTIGYKRQEAVVMPLVANVASGAGNADELIPCGSPGGTQVSEHEIKETKASTPAENIETFAEKCLIVGENTKSGSRDSYSVLASFGAKFGGRTFGTTPEASVGIAQYFATGVAAQLLAVTGGASIVSTAAQEPMTPAKSAAVAAVMNPDEAQSAALGAANYEQAVKAGIAQGTKALALILQTRICLKDSTIGPKLRDAIVADSRTKVDAKTIIEAGTASQQDLTDYFQTADPVVEKAIAEIVALKC